ncbi:MAG: Gldg family protein [Bacteroidales bacterium]|nr:Gldg family protein [Candidatus Latescibacterota bacterium]
MKRTDRQQKYYRFLLYLAVVVLVNIAGLTLFFRLDLTANRLYSLSDASIEAVSTLSEPLTINVFFTKDLPAPHNNTERYLHDLLEEYSAHSNRYFNYRFYDVSAEEGDISEKARKNQELARGYGIYPVQIQNIEQDEVKFKKAYMGMVMMHGDVLDKIPSITTTEGLEYRLTSMIEKMNSKISVLLNLEEPVDIRLYLSSSLSDIASRLRIGDIRGVSGQLGSIVEELNKKYYGKLVFASLDPSNDPAAQKEAVDYGVLTLRWPSQTQTVDGQPAQERGSAGIVISSGGKHVAIPLINVVRVPLFGTQYNFADMATMNENLSEVIDDVLDINKKIGFLSGHGALPLSGGQQMPGQPPQQEGLSNLNALISEEYSINSVDLGEGIPDGIDCLVIAGPTQEFNDYELFQIDQFLMKGKSLALFLDPFEEIAMQGQQMNYNQGPVYRPLNTGLEKLLGHYGLEVSKSYVLDENCFEQRLPEMYGGGKQAIYFAPVIRDENINNRLPFMKNIKALISILSSPVELKPDRLEAVGLEGGTVFSSSARSWEMSGRINLNPMFLRPPDDPGELKSSSLAAIVTGEFPSYFMGREIPEKPVSEEAAADSIEAARIKMDAARAAELAEGIEGEGAFIEKGEAGKLVVVGSAALLKNNVLDQGGESTNATFVMNLLDHLNGRDQYAEMRSKMQRYNPLRETSGGTKTLVKSFNIAGLPVIVALFGVIVWLRRKARKKRIEMMFSR